MNTTPKIWELVSVLILARHGKAVAAEGRPDAERKLNELGIAQANALGFSVQKLEIDIVLSSPLKRVVSTMRTATNDTIPIHPVAELTCSDDPIDPIQIMWGKLGNVPISRYFAEAAGEYLKVWGQTALGAIIRELQNGGHDQKVLVGGHAVLQNALLWAISQSVSEDCWAAAGMDEVNEIACQNLLGEGEAFVLRFPSHEAGVTTCEHLRPMA